MQFYIHKPLQNRGLLFVTVYLLQIFPTMNTFHSPIPDAAPKAATLLVYNAIIFPKCSGAQNTECTSKFEMLIRKILLVQNSLYNVFPTANTRKADLSSRAV